MDDARKIVGVGAEDVAGEGAGVRAEGTAMHSTCIPAFVTAQPSAIPIVLRDSIIADRYTRGLERMQDIARDYGITRQAVWYALRRTGVKTPKKSSMQVSCAMCGAVLERTRKKVRVQRQHFCDQVCYTEWLERGKGLGQDSRYVASRLGQRHARAIVEEYIELKPGYLVHHEDRNAKNNELDNLRVFACTGDHLRHHRGFIVPIVWDGRMPGKKRR